MLRVLLGITLVSAGVEELTQANFRDFLKENKRVLVKFTAPWCGHCKAIAPEFDQAAEALEAEGLESKLANVDATVEKELGTEFDVSGYPTLKYFVDGQAQEYDGGRKKDDFVGFLRGREKPVVSEITAEDYEKYEKEPPAEHTVLAVLKAGSARFKVLTKVAEKLRDAKQTNFVFYFKALAKDKDPKKDATMSLVSKHRGETFKFQDAKFVESKVFKFLVEESLGLVAKLDPKLFDFKFLLENGYEDGLFLAFKEKGELKDFAAAEDKLKKELEVLAKANKAIKFAYTTVEDAKDNTEYEAFKIAGDSVMFLKEGEKLRYKKTDHKDLKQFIADVQANKVKAYYKSEPITNPLDNGVTVLNGDNFEEIALDPKKDVFVEFYAPWCGHCKALAPKWEALAAKIKEKKLDSKVIIAKFDATANESRQETSGFPTLVLYPATARSFERKISNGGDRETDKLYDFLVENAKHMEGIESEGNKGEKKKSYSMVDRELEKKKKAAGKKTEL